MSGYTWSGSDLSEAAATAPDIVEGAGLWATTTQISRIVLDGGGANLLTGTDIAVFGLSGVLS